MQSGPAMRIKTFELFKLTVRSTRSYAINFLYLCMLRRQHTDLNRDVFLFQLIVVLDVYPSLIKMVIMSLGLG